MTLEFFPGNFFTIRYWLLRCRILKWTEHLPSRVLFSLFALKLTGASGWDDVKVVLSFPSSQQMIQVA